MFWTEPREASGDLLVSAPALARKGATGRTAHETQPLVFAGGLCLGAVIYLTASFEPPVLIVMPLPALCLLVWLAQKSDGSRAVSLILSAMMGLTLGLAAAQLHARSKPQISLPSADQPVLVEGWITAIEPGRNGARLRIRPHAISTLPTERLPKQIRLTHRLSLNVSPGRFVRCFAHIRPPPGPAAPGDYDFRRQAYFEGLGGVGYVLGRCRGGVLGAPTELGRRLEVSIGSARRQLGLFAKDAAGERAGGFAAALVSGDRSHMNPDDAEALRASGLAHLLAISGLHLGIVGGLVYVLVFRLCALIEPLALRVPVQKIAALAALLACAIYLTLSGASVSTQRAFIMAMVAFTAILLDRPALSLRSFTIAMVLVVLAQPASVLSAGFQMSFSATGALILLYQGWMRRRSTSASRSVARRFIFALQSIVATSVVASLATLPFALYHFERAAPLGLLANCLAMPVISFVSAPAAALSILLTPFGLADWGLRLFGLSLELVLAIAHWTASVELPNLPRPTNMPGASLLGFSGAIACTLVMPGRWGWCVAAGLVTVGAVVWRVQTAPHIYWAASGDVFVRETARSPDYLRVGFVDGDGLGPLQFVDLPTAQDCSGGCRLLLARSGDILLVPRGTPSWSRHCASVPPRLILVEANAATRQSCAPVLLWERIQVSGGAAITLLNGGRIRTRYPAQCGRRPWHPCRPE